MDEREHLTTQPDGRGGAELLLPHSAGRRFLESHPWLVDAAVPGLFTLPVLLAVVARGIAGRAPVHVLDVVVVLVTGAALLFRRRRPLLVLAAVTALTAVFSWSTDSNLLLAVSFAVYAVALRHPLRVAWPASAGSFVVGTVAFLFWLSRSSPPGPMTNLDPGVVILTYALTILIGLALGAGVRARVERERILTERAEQLVRDRDSQAASRPWPSAPASPGRCTTSSPTACR